MAGGQIAAVRVPVEDGLLGKIERGCQVFWVSELLHDVMIPCKQSHDCLQYRDGVASPFAGNPENVDLAELYASAILLRKLGQDGRGI